MLFFATMVNYMDRQVLSLTWKDFISPELGWDDDSYGIITGAFSIMYAMCMLFVGRIVDRVGTKRGYAVSMIIWTCGAVLHSLCGIACSGIIADEWFVSFDGAKEALHDIGYMALPVTTVSVWLFLACRFILALGEAGNFPAAIKVTAEYFPKKDRAYATSIFNNGASVGALIAPVTIPPLAKYMGWEMAFILIGFWGYVWAFVWLRVYNRPHNSRHVNKAELGYIMQDDMDDDDEVTRKSRKEMGIIHCLGYRQTWAFIIGKFMTDGVWIFFLFWTPAYISDMYSYSSDSLMGMALIFVLYLISMLSVAGGYLPTYFVDSRGMHPYGGRMLSMLIFAVIPLIGVAILPLGSISPWCAVVIIGIIGAAHQSWSANIFSTVGDLFPKAAIGTVTGIGGMAGGVGSFIINYGAGYLFTLSDKLGTTFCFLGFYGKQGGYMAVFCICSVAYLVGWIVMRMLVPRYQPVEC